MAIPENSEEAVRSQEIDGEKEIKQEVTLSEEAETGSSVVVVVRGGYKKDHPPEDDCCPICFDSFQFPCRTNCGHWYCGSCFLQLWRHIDNIEWCECPMCRSVVKKLIPYSSTLIPPEEDGRQILKDLRAYNHQSIRIWFAFFVQVLYFMLQMIAELRRLPPKDDEYRRRSLLRRTYSEITIVVGMTINIWRFGFIPYWLGVIMVTPFACFQVMCAPVMIFFECDDRWFRRRRHERRWAQTLQLLRERRLRERRLAEALQLDYLNDD